jgi:uncharacterized protein
MAWPVLESLLDKYSDYCVRRNIGGSIAFHGGEPLLMGIKFFEKTLSHHAFKRGVLRASVQTNGLLLDERWIDFLDENNVGIGISLDGPPEVNDRHRVSAGGRGSYAQVRRAISLLQKKKKNFLVLCVVDPSADGEEVFTHFVEMGIRRLDFLPPISSHADQERLPVDLEGVERFLVRAFLAWVKHGNPDVQVRLFSEMTWRYQLGTGGYSPIGMDDWKRFAVLETDGYFARCEELAGISSLDNIERYKTRRHIQRDSIEDAVLELDFDSTLFDHFGLPTKCKHCEMNDICNGGNIASRFDKRGSFDNPGVHCRSFYTLSRLIKILTRSRPDSLKPERNSQ